MGKRGTLRRLFWPVAAAGLVVGVLLVWLDVLPGAYVFAPLLGVFIYLFGVASLASFQRGAAYIPDGPPEPVDTRAERTTYWCAGCGAELLLLVRGAAVPPRHCGERMVERHEVARGLS
jgi:DNA-directed RNA polymerase subunit RPC12/RpoP